MTFGAFFTSVRRSMSDKMAAAARRGPIPPGGQQVPAVSTPPAPTPPVNATGGGATRSASTQASAAGPTSAEASQAQRMKDDEWNYLIIDEFGEPWALPPPWW